MNDRFPPLIDPADLPARVLCLAPHPDDEVLGCGGLLSILAVAPDGDVRVVVLTGKQGGKRAEESRRASEELGYEDPRFLGLEDGGLEALEDLRDRIARELADFEPGLVLAPSPTEFHPDHAAVGRAAMAACRGPRLLFYGINAPLPVGLLVDTTKQWEKKRAALRCFESQIAGQDLVGKAEAGDRARTINLDDPRIFFAEAFVDPSDERTGALGRELAALAAERAEDELAATAVISTWNKAADVCENLAALRRQTRPFAAIVVVDNASGDDTVERVSREFPGVELVVMPHSAYGACETFNIGFACARTPLIAILDDDVVLPPEWLEKAVARLAREPETTAVISTKVVEPEMPESYKSSEAVNRERYMSTFRGCGSLVRTAALREAGGYDERLFIFGNERDLTCRLLNLGYRVLQYPEVETFHKTPFGVHMGKRSLYYHARNAWLTMLKYAPLPDLARMPWLVLTRVLLRRSASEEAGEVSDATGTIGIGRAVRQTPGGWWVVVRAAFSVLANLPYCLRHRAPCRSEDFELPLK